MGTPLRAEPSPGDVALFIDWENIKRSVLNTFERMPDLSAIKKAAMQFGRLTVAKAYANWQDGQHQNDCEILYKQGIDPVFVATRRGVSSETREELTCPHCGHRWTRATREEFIKDSADVRMAIECVREVLTHDDLHTVVLASGDGAMLHVVNLVKSLGKAAVVIAVSESFTPPLTYLADKFILYDDLVSGFTSGEKGREGQVDEALKALQVAVQEIRTYNLENTFPVLKTLIRRRLTDFEEETLGFPKFEYFVFRAEKEGLVRADVRGWQQEVYLGNETCSLSGKPLFGPKEWGWLITRCKDKGPQYQNVLMTDISNEKVLAAMPEARAEDLISAALESGVMMRHREIWHFPPTAEKEPRTVPHVDLRLNELNSRVQVYLGLEMRPPTVRPVPPAPPAAPGASAAPRGPAAR